jgi:hypothetical protein
MLQSASPVRAGLAHRDDLVLADAGAQQVRDPFDVSLEGVGQLPVLFGRRRRRVGHQQKLGPCIDQRGGRGPEVVLVPAAAGADGVEQGVLPTR